MGVKPGKERERIICHTSAKSGYCCCLEHVETLATRRPLGIILDISPFSDDGWGLLLKIKDDPALRNIPVLLVFLSEDGKVAVSSR